MVTCSKCQLERSLSLYQFEKNEFVPKQSALTQSYLDCCLLQYIKYVENHDTNNILILLSYNIIGCVLIMDNGGFKKCLR